MNDFRETFYLGAYWGDREEDLDSCAVRLTNFLKGLRDCDEIFHRWFKTGWSRKEALANEMPVEFDKLRELLDKEGKHRTDIGSRVMEDLGFSVCLWNGRDPNNGAVGLSVSCGSYAGHPGIMNSCVINLPNEGSVVERVISSVVLEKMLCITARCWEPNCGLVTGDTLRDMFEVAERTPYYAWVFFLSKRRGEVPKLPEPSRKKVLDGLGTIVVVTDDRFDTKRKEHIKAVKRVYRILKKAKLLEPIPQCEENPNHYC